MLADEARAMLTRLARVKPFALHETMVPAAAVSVAAQAAIEEYLAAGRRELRARIHAFLDWLRANAGHVTLEQAHRRLAFLRLRFNAVLTHFDVFAIVMTQRSEHETGVWLSGLDVVARDALRLPGASYALPPVVCYLDRGFGAAIRRARTRLPGGGESPVAIIRVPRERMIGSGIASSLVHEVGHQGAALLDLVNRLRVRLQKNAGRGGPTADAWHLWARWISEIVADFWSVAMLGVGSTLGLMGVLSLPRAFIFRGASDDPHPIPWVRVKLSCAMGEALYPHPQWRRLSDIWSSFYPLRGLNDGQRRIIALLERTMPQLIACIAQDRPPQLGGRTLIEAMPIAERTPERLSACFARWQSNPREWRSAAPTLAFAVLGQARADGRLSPEREGRLLAELLAFWALRTTIDTSEACAREPSPWETPRTFDVLQSPLGTV
jgi:hypothetical protein